jgi:hypothetical protein
MSSAFFDGLAMPNSSLKHSPPGQDTEIGKLSLGCPLYLYKQIRQQSMRNTAMGELLHLQHETLGLPPDEQEQVHSSEI